MSNLFAVIPDANVLIALCAKETDSLQIAETAFEDYTNQVYEFFAPSVLVAEVIFVLCQKLAGGDTTNERIFLLKNSLLNKIILLNIRTTAV